MKSPLQYFQWIPRIICIIDILFISMFALDAFNAHLPLSEQLKDFFTHLIPSIILIGILLLAWKKELLGGLLFIIIALVMSPFIFNHNYANNHSFEKSFMIITLIAFPFIAVGLLFIMSAVMKERTKINS